MLELLKAMGVNEKQKIFIKSLRTGLLTELAVTSIKELVINRYENSSEDKDNRSAYIVILLPKETEEKLTSMGSPTGALAFIGEKNPFSEESMKPIPWTTVSAESSIRQKGLNYLEKKFDLGKRDLKPLAQSYTAGKTELFLIAFEFPNHEKTESLDSMDNGFYLYLLKPENSDPVILDAVQGAGDNRYEPTVLVGKILKEYDEVIYEGGEGSLDCGTLFLISKDKPAKLLRLQLDCKPSSC